jgi:hypothetical protein
MVIVEYLRCFKQADAMLLLVFTSLLRIPLKYQHRASNSNLTFAVNRAPILARWFQRRDWVASRTHHKSSGFKPVRFAIRASIRGPISSRS